jgi:transposase-like protein
MRGRLADRWRCDETYMKVKGRWTYLYRAVDKVGRTVDFYLSERRDVNAAKHFFFRKAMKSVGPPRVITLDAQSPQYLIDISADQMPGLFCINAEV